MNLQRRVIWFDFVKYSWRVFVVCFKNLYKGEHVLKDAKSTTIQQRFHWRRCCRIGRSYCHNDSPIACERLGDALVFCVSFMLFENFLSYINFWNFYKRLDPVNERKRGVFLVQKLHWHLPNSSTQSKEKKNELNPIIFNSYDSKIGLNLPNLTKKLHLREWSQLQCYFSLVSNSFR